MDEKVIRDIVEQVLRQTGGTDGVCDSETIPVEVSARHVHLCREHIDRLFGKGHELTPVRELSQPGEFLCKERVKLVSGKSEIANVAVLGPARNTTQVELSATDARQMGIKAPVRLSGDLRDAGDVLILGENGFVHVENSVIVARNHIHMPPADAQRLGVADKQRVQVAVDGERPLVFSGVTVRVSDSFVLSMHIDFDEANACACAGETRGRLIK